MIILISENLVFYQDCEVIYMMKNVELYVNQIKDDAIFIAKKIEKALLDNGYNITESEPNLVIGFGGDGTLIHWLRSTNYNTNSKYIGVNCGTLGFLQDFDITNPEVFVKNIPNYIEEKLNFVSLTLCTGNEVINYQALNEFNIKNNDDNSFIAKVMIENVFLENLRGTGFIFSTPTGSTAHNISSIGSIIYPGIEAIMMTPREAIVNSKIRCLPKSICIPKGIEITLFPVNDDDIKILSDGRKIYTGKYERISISYSNKYMTKLTNKSNNFVSKIREKLI